MNIIKDALFPVSCSVCGQFFHPCENSWQAASVSLPEGLAACFSRLLAHYLCPACVGQFTAAESPICTSCGMIFKSRQDDDHLCGDCITSEKPYRMARAAGVHDQSLMSIMHAYKYDGKVQLAEPLSKLMTAVYVRHWRPADIDLVLPIPLHPARFRKRGFNQAYLLARSWGDVVKRDILERTRRTSPQTGLGRKERLKNVKGAFAVKSAAAVKDKHVLLVDDVYTTGATVKECARILKKSGAVQVDILTIGRAVT